MANGGQVGIGTPGGPNLAQLLMGAGKASPGQPGAVAPGQAPAPVPTLGGVAGGVPIQPGAAAFTSALQQLQAQPQRAMPQAVQPVGVR